VTINGAAQTVEPTNGYITLRRAWNAGDVVALDLPLTVRRLVTHPLVAENQGRVALMRGPLLYCIEGDDHPDADVREIILPDDAPITTAWRADLLGGVVTLSAPALAAERPSGWDAALYREAAGGETTRPATLTAIPYYAWANRADSPMLVWVRAV
jgi:hypothetical protein